MKLETGTKLGPYEIVAPLGVGGMGEVYRARDTRLKRDVAIKVLPAAIANDAAALARFQREAEAVAALSHPNIIVVHDIGLQEEQKYIVMELLEGVSLQQYIETNPIDVDHAIDHAIQLADALAAAHAKGVIHRDVKPANIFVTHRRTVKLLDFGLAKLAPGTRQDRTPNDTTQTAMGTTTPGTVLGTICYMSPELALGRELDPRSDIFSFGAVLYEMITGRRAFDGDTTAAVFDAILNRAPPAPASLIPSAPGELERIINKALEKDPDLRYQSAAELRSDLMRLQRDGSIESSATHPTRRSVWRSGMIIAAIVVLALAAWALESAMNRTDSAPADVAATDERLTLVVLPFENIGGDPEQESFVDGMTDEMITVLGRANPEKLGVIARTSAMHVKDQAYTIPTIRRELGVSYVVEGTVRRQGDRVRISAKLVDADDETQVWSNIFNGTLHDIFALQSRVANQIADALAVTLLPNSTPAQREHVPDSRAYEEYLSGRYSDHKGNEQGWKNAIAHYRKAVEIDPDYALAYASLSQTCSTLSSWTTVSPDQPLQEAKEAMERAFELEPNLPDAHVAQAYYLLLGKWAWQEVDDAFQRALVMQPTNPGMAWHWYGHFLTFAGRDDEAIGAFKSALRSDPLSALHRACLGSAQIAAGDLEAAELSITRALELDPELPVAHNWLGLLRERQGRLTEAVKAWENGARCSNNVALLTGALGYGYGRIGETDKARAILEQLRQGGGSDDGYVSELNLARVYAGLGDSDRAFEQLEIAVDQREPWILALKVSPGFDTIRDDPRFAALLRRIGVEP